jgi:hypothetical protein
MSDNERAHIPMDPSLLAWAFAFPSDPVAMKVIDALTPDQVPKLKELFEKERRGHAEASVELAILLGLRV